jgi:hypothetical protein
VSPSQIKNYSLKFQKADMSAPQGEAVHGHVVVCVRHASICGLPHRCPCGISDGEWGQAARARRQQAVWSLSVDCVLGSSWTLRPVMAVLLRPGSGAWQSTPGDTRYGRPRAQLNWASAVCGGIAR